MDLSVKKDTCLNCNIIMLYIKENKEIICQPALISVSISLLSYCEIGEQLSQFLFGIPKVNGHSQRRKKGY